MVSKIETATESVSAIYSIISNRNQILVFSHARLIIITMTGKKVGCLCLLASYSYFSTDRTQYQGNLPCFNMPIHKSVLNDAINYTQKGCTMQMWGITLSSCEIKAWKNSSPNRTWTHDLCDTSAVLYQLYLYRKSAISIATQYHLTVILKHE